VHTLCRIVHHEPVLSPASIPLVARHLDSVDAYTARKLVGIRPWNEPGLTSLLCDLLDDRTQSEYTLGYPISALRADLSSTEPLLDLAFSIETHEYDASLERWVTQADLGLVISYHDRVVPGRSFESAWLLQAKRLYPWPDGRYDERCEFKAIDKRQAERIQKLNEELGLPLVRYLLYRPRPSDLDERTAGVLAHLRLAALSDHIFDYGFGLAVRDALLTSPSTLAAGLFVTSGSVEPSDLRTAHAGLLATHDPLAWFVLRHFSDPEEVPPSGETVSNGDLAVGLARGRPDAIAELRDRLDIGDRASESCPRTR
jgi:hypothetical protein